MNLITAMRPEAFRDWMGQDTPPGSLKDIISTKLHQEFRFRPVSKAVNSVKNNSADLIETA